MLLALAATAVLVLATTPPSQAHADLVRSSPAAGAVIPRLPERAVLVFSDDLASRFVTVTLSSPIARPVALNVRVRGSRVVASLPPARSQAGTRWTLAYKLASQDGHSIQGRVGFEVSGPTSSAETPPPTEYPTTDPVSRWNSGQPASADDEPRKGGSGSTPPSWAVGIGIVTAVALAGAWRVAKTRLSRRLP